MPKYHDRKAILGFVGAIRQIGDAARLEGRRVSLRSGVISDHDLKRTSDLLDGAEKLYIAWASIRLTAQLSKRLHRCAPSIANRFIRRAPSSIPPDSSRDARAEVS